MIEAAILTAALMQPREINCSTRDPPSALCCRVIRQVMRDRRITKESHAILGVYVDMNCKGAEFAGAAHPLRSDSGSHQMLARGHGRLTRVGRLGTAPTYFVQLVECTENPGRGKWIYR